MSGDLFRLWTRDEIVVAIREIEEQLSLNVQTVSYSGGGTVSNGTPENARKTLRSLYARLDSIDGVKSQSSSGPNFWTLVSRRF
jgi:hypothetical protein